jgi:hypothetical protein
VSPRNHTQSKTPLVTADGGSSQTTSIASDVKERQLLDQTTPLTLATVAIVQQKTEAHHKRQLQMEGRDRDGDYTTVGLDVISALSSLKGTRCASTCLSCADESVEEKTV